MLSYKPEKKYLKARGEEAIKSGLVPLPKGEDGKDYVITQKDYEEIATIAAKKVRVPIVEKVIEKTEVIREVPVVTGINEVKEEVKNIKESFGNTVKNIESDVLGLNSELEGNKIEIEGKLKSLKETLEGSKLDLLNKLANQGGGSMNRQIRVNGTDVLTKYTDINFTGSLSATADNTNKRVNIAIDSQTITVGSSNADYTTLQSAKAAATAGYKIRVLPGTYTITNETLAKDDVHWHFEPGAIVNATYSESSNNRAVFDDNDGAITCVVTGLGVFNVTATTGNVTNNDATTFTGGGCVRVFNASSVFHFEADSGTIEGTASSYIGSSNAKFLHQATGILSVSIAKNITASAGSECWVWQGGVNTISCPRFISERDAVNFNRNSNTPYAKTQLITDYIEGGEHPLRFMSHATDLLSTAEVIVNTIEGFVLTASHVIGGRFTVIAGRITDQIHSWGNSNTVCNFQIGTHEAKDGHLFALFSSTNYYTAKKLVRTGSSSEDTAYRIHGGTVIIEGVDMRSVVGDNVAVLIPADESAVTLSLRDCLGTCDGLENTSNVNASVTFTVSTAGDDSDVLTLTLDDGANPTDDFQVTQDGGKSTDDIASEMAGAVDAHASYTASAVGSVVSITCIEPTSWGGGNAVNGTGSISGGLSAQSNYDPAHAVGCVYAESGQAITITMRNCDFRATNSSSNTVGVRITDAADSMTYALCTGNGTNNALTTGGSGTFTNLTPGITIPLGTTAYTPSNVTTDRSYNANATTTDELADVLGTLIADLQGKGIIS